MNTTRDVLMYDDRAGTAALIEWHREEGHAGRFELCEEEPCRSVVRAATRYPWEASGIEEERS